MNNILQIVKEFEGIIGAVLGSVATLIATDYLSKKGKLKIYLMKYEGIYETYKDVGCYSGEEKELQLYHFRLNYKLQVYNKSDTPKIMRDFKILFIRDKKVLYYLVPDDEATRRFSAHTYMVDEMEVSNVMPREIQVLEQSGYISEEELGKIEGATKIELVYFDEKDRKRRVVLYKGEVSKNNYKPQIE